MSAYDILMRKFAVVESMANTQNRDRLSAADALNERRLELAAEVEANKNSWSSRLNLDPDSAAGTVVNLGANLASGVATIGGNLAAMPAYIGAMHDSSQLTDAHYQAYDRYRNGKATPDDVALLQRNIYDDGRPDTPNFLQAIQSAENKRQLGRDISERFNIDGIVHQRNRNALVQDLKSGFGDSWDQVKSGWESLDYGKVGSSTADIATGLGKLLLNVGDAAINNKMGVTEFVVQNIPQLALGMFGKAGMTALSANNIGYAANEYQKGLEKFQKENGGSLPSYEQRQEMAMYAASLALVEQAGDAFALMGINRAAGRIAGTVDDVTKTGFKAALKGYGGAVARSNVVESATEGWQTYAEGKAGLEEKSAEDIYVGAAIGSLVGGGMTSTLGAPGAIKQAFQGANAEAQAQLLKEKANREAIQAAVDAGTPDAFLDKNSPAYSPDKALGVLHALSTKEDVTPEQRAEYATKASQIHTELSKEVNSLKAGVDNTVLQEELKLAQQDLARATPGSVSHQEAAQYVQLLQDELAAGALPPQEIERRQALLSTLEPMLEKAQTMYEVLSNETKVAQVKDLDATKLVSDIEAATDATAPEVAASASKLRVLSMVSPSSVSIQQATALASSSKLSDGDKKYWQAYVNSETAAAQLKSMGAVGQEILEGNEKLNQKGLTDYRARFGQFLSQNNTHLANKEISQLNRFIENQEGKVNAMKEAMAANARTGLSQYIKKEQDGTWSVTPIAKGNTVTRNKGEYVINQKDSKKLVQYSVSGLDAMVATRASMETLLTAHVSQAQSVPAPVTTPDTTAVAGVPATVTAQPSVDTGAVGSNTTPVTAGQSQSPTSVIQPTNASTSPVSIPETTPTPTVSEAPAATQTNQEAVTDVGNAATIEGVPTESGQSSTVEATGVTEKKPKTKRAALNPEVTKELEQIDLSFEVVNESLSEEGIVEMEDFNNVRLEQETNNETTNTTEASTTEDGRGQAEAVTQEAVSTAPEGSTGQPEVDQGTREAEQEPVTAKLSVFSSQDPATQLVRDTLTQSAGSTNGTQRPLVVVADFLNALIADGGLLNRFLKNEPTVEQAKAAQKLIGFADKWSSSIQKMLRTEAPAYFYNSPVSYLINSTDGKLDLDPNAKTAMTVAVMTWAADAFKKGFYNKEEDIRSILGLDEHEDIPSIAWNTLGRVGTRRAVVAATLGKRITQSLGLKASKDAPKDLMAEIEAGLGGYAIQLMLQEGVVRESVVKGAQWDSLLGVTGSKDQIFIQLSNNEMQPTDKVRAVLDVTKGSANILQNLFGIEEGTKLPSFDPVPFKQPRVQKGKTLVPKLLAKILAKKNQEPHFLKTWLWDAVQAMPEDMVYEMAGAVDFDKTAIQASRVASVEATNDGIIREIQNIKEFIESSWEEVGFDKPIFMQYNVWKQQRVGIANTVLNPQSSKVARHLLYKPDWKVEIDTNNTQQLDDFKLRVLEAFGVKTDKQDNTKSLSEWESKIENDIVKQAVAALVSRREGNDFTSEQQQAILKAVKFGKEKFRTLDALNALADMSQAKEGKFTSDLVGEVDGVTNGPMLSHLLLGAASTAQHLMQTLVKGGFYRAEDGSTNYNLWRSLPNSMDLYETVASYIVKEVNRSKNPIFGAIQLFTGNLGTEEGKVTKDGRDIVKRPITALNFGSSPQKAVQGMAEDFTESIFKTIEKYKQDGKDPAPLVIALNMMLPAGAKLALNTDIDTLLNKQFTTAELRAIKDTFSATFGKITEKTLKVEFGSIGAIRKKLNQVANFSFDVYNAAYQTVRQEYITELVNAGKIELNKAGNPKWDLTDAQEAEIQSRLSSLRPVYHTAMSKLSGSLASGLLVSKTETKTSSNPAYATKTLFVKADGSKGEMSLNAQETTETGPGVTTIPFLIHSFDSAVSHIAAEQSQSLNIHDAHVTGVGDYNQIAENLNKALWSQLLHFSPAEEVYKSLERTAYGVVKLYQDPNTSDAVKTVLVSYDLIAALQAAKEQAVASDTVRLETLSKLVAVDQYALEGGQYEVTEADRKQAEAALSAVKNYSSVPKDLIAGLEAIRTGAPVNKVKAETVNISEEINASEAETLNLLNEVDTPEIKQVVALTKESTQSVNEATQQTLGDIGTANQVPIIGAVAREARSTPFGVLGTPAIQPEADVVALMEANPSMTGKDLVQKLYGLLQARGTAPQAEFYKQLLKMTMKALGDVQVKYVTPETAESEVTAKPDKASRGWYVSDGTIYVLSPEFVVSGLTAEVLVHELVHAAITEMLNSPSTPEQKQAVEELNTLLNKAKEYVATNNLTQYNEAVANLDEMVAWGMSNAGFQKDVLRQLKITSKTKIQVVADGLQAFVNSLIKLVFPRSRGAESNHIDGFSALLGNVTLMYASAAKAQKGQIKQAANKVLSMATVHPAQAIAGYTTEQVFDALSGNSGFAEKLKTMLDDVVTVMAGPMGAIKSTVGTTAAEAWLNAAANNGRPFMGKVLASNVKFTEQEAFVAEQIEAVMSEVLNDKGSANNVLFKEATKLYDQARTTLKGKIDTDLYKFLFMPQRGMGGKSDYMQRFFALALAHEGFSKSLQFETHKADLTFKGKTFFQRVETLWRAAMDWISAKRAGTYLGQRADHRIEALARKLVQVEAKNKSKIAYKTPFDLFQPMEEGTKNLLDKAKNMVVKGASSNFVQKNRIMAMQVGGKIVRNVVGGKAQIIMDNITKMGDKAKEGRPTEGIQMVNYIKGPSQWLDHVIRSAKRIEGQRKHLITDTAKHILSTFAEGGSYLKDHHKKAVSAVLLRTGAHLLMDKFKVSGIQAMLENNKLLNQAIQTEIGLLSAYPEVHYWIAQAKGLAFKQVTGWAGVERQNLNAHNIAHLYNTGRPSPANAKEVIPNLERLIALYGLQYSDAGSVNSLLEVMRKETPRGDDNGIAVTLRMHQKLEQESKEKLFVNSEALHMHGYLPEVHNPHVEIAIAKTPEEALALEEDMFVFKTEVPLYSHDPEAGSVKLYYRKGAGLTRRQSGAFSLTGTNARGKQKHGSYFNPLSPVGMANTQSMNDIYNSEQSAVDRQFLPNPGFKPNRAENRLVPLVNAQGQMVDYRYTMKEELRDELLERDNRFEHLLGVMAGSTYDKENSRVHNKQLAKDLRETYKEDFGANPSKYTFIGKKSGDPEMKEIWDLLPSNTKQDIISVWGGEGMWVPKELVTPLFGYRKASLSTLFDLENRTKMQQMFIDFTTWLARTYGVHGKGLRGADADKYAKQTKMMVRVKEDQWQEIVQAAKDTIVVKTATVLWGNMTSNVTVLWANGLNPITAMMYQKEGLNAVLDYISARDELAQVNLQLATMSGVNNQDELKARVVELEDAIARNPAKDLIDAGLLPTIVEDLDMEDNPYSYKSEFTKKLNAKVAKLNRHVVDAGKQVLMTHDTTLYQVLSKSTQYSDFVARYALYKYQTTKKNPLSKEEALFNGSEAFINYDIPMPKTLQYLDDHGFMPFIKYAFSIQRVIMRLVQEKPLSLINSMVLGNALDMSMLTDASWIHRIGNNPFSLGIGMYPTTLDDLATVKLVSGMFK